MTSSRLEFLQTAISSTSSQSSLERRACRICQSETGQMVRPCSCQGSIGQIHSGCLNTWVTMSQKKQCEICHDEYHREGERYKPLSEWTKPSCGYMEFILLWLILGLIGSLIYLILLVGERKMFIRWLNSQQTPMRIDDLGRMVFILTIFILLVATSYKICKAIISYFKKQKEIRFIDKSD